MNREALLEIVNDCLLNLKQAETPKMGNDAAKYKRLTGACLIPLSFWSSQLHTISLRPFRMITLTGLSRSPVKRQVTKEEPKVTQKIMKLTGYSVTWKNMECCGLSESICFNVVFSITHFS